MYLFGDAGQFVDWVAISYNDAPAGESVVLLCASGDFAEFGFGLLPRSGDHLRCSRERVGQGNRGSRPDAYESRIQTTSEARYILSGVH